VTQKVIKHAVRQAEGQKRGEQVETLKLGNLSAVRDWGHAADFCALY